MTDKLIERINEIGDLISQHQHLIFLLEEEVDILLDDLSKLQEKQRQADNRDWRMMKL